MELSRLVPRLRVSRLVGALLIGLSVVAGYFVASWWSGPRDATQLARICARVDYLNSLQEEVSVGQTITVLTASTVDEIDTVFATAARQQVAALLINGDAFFTRHVPISGRS